MRKINNIIRPFITITCVRCRSPLPMSNHTGNSYMADTKHDCIPIIDQFHELDEDGRDKKPTELYWGMKYDRDIRANEIYEERKRKHIEKYGMEWCLYGITRGLHDWRCADSCRREET